MSGRDGRGRGQVETERHCVFWGRVFVHGLLMHLAVGNLIALSSFYFIFRFHSKVSSILFVVLRMRKSIRIANQLCKCALAFIYSFCNAIYFDIYIYLIHIIFVFVCFSVAAPISHNCSPQCTISIKCKLRRLSSSSSVSSVRVHKIQFPFVCRLIGLCVVVLYFIWLF